MDQTPPEPVDRDQTPAEPDTPAAPDTAPPDLETAAPTAEEAEPVVEAVSPSTGRPTFQDWWQAARPPFYIATLAPLTLGFTAAVKYTGQYRWGLFFLILFGSFLVHLATNLANDLFDHEIGRAHV